MATKAINLAKPLQSASFSVATAAKLNTALDMPVQLAAAQSQGLQNAMRPLAGAAGTRPPTAANPVAATGRVMAIIRDVEPPKDGNADVRVFVNCPYLTAETPVEDRHYAGSFTFFGGQHVA